VSLESPPELEKLRRAFAAEGPPEEPCPPAERIFAAAHGELAGEAGEAELGEILDHVAACAECAESWRLAVELGRELGAGAPAAEERPAGRLIAADFRRPGEKPAGARRWAMPMAVVAALLLAAIALQLLPKAPKTDPALRGNGEAKIEDVTGPLERGRCVLRWRLAPAADGALFEVRVMSEDLELLAERSALPAGNLPTGELPTGELTVPPERLAKIPAGGWLLWQVRASLPDGRQVDSETFRSRLP
jgi:hypothetical protein